LQVLVKLVGVLVMEALDGGLFEGAVQARDLAVGSRVRRLGRAVLHVVCAAAASKAVPARKPLVGLYSPPHITPQHRHALGLQLRADGRNQHGAHGNLHVAKVGSPDAAGVAARHFAVDAGVFLAAVAAGHAAQRGEGVGRVKYA